MPHPDQPAKSPVELAQADARRSRLVAVAAHHLLDENAAEAVEHATVSMSLSLSAIAVTLTDLQGEEG